MVQSLGWQEFERFVQQELEAEPTQGDITPQLKHGSVSVSPSPPREYLSSQYEPPVEPLKPEGLGDTEGGTLTGVERPGLLASSFMDEEPWDEEEALPGASTNLPSARGAEPPRSSLVNDLFHSHAKAQTEQKRELPTQSVPAQGKATRVKAGSLSRAEREESQQRISELERELLRYKTENERVQRLRGSHQKELAKLRGEQAAFEDYKVTEMERFKATSATDYSI